MMKINVNIVPKLLFILFLVLSGIFSNNVYGFCVYNNTRVNIEAVSSASIFYNWSEDISPGAHKCCPGCWTSGLFHPNPAPIVITIDPSEVEAAYQDDYKACSTGNALSTSECTLAIEIFQMLKQKKKPMRIHCQKNFNLSPHGWMNVYMTKEGPGCCVDGDGDRCP